MRTPPLDRRFVGWGLAVVAATMLIIDVLVYAGVRVNLMADLDRLLDERAATATAEAHKWPAHELAGRLADLGIRATVTTPEGRFGADPGAPAVDIGVASPSAEGGGAFARRQVALPGGGDVVVYTRSSNVHRALRNVVGFEALGLALAMGIAALLLTRMAQIILRPLREVADTARRTSAGRVGERLRPDQPETALGQLASAYDDMVDALEQAVDDARRAQRRSEELGDDTRRLAAIVQSAQDAMYSEDLEGTILSWNESACVLFGYSAPEVVGRPAAMLVAPEERAEVADYHALVRAGRSIPHLETCGLTRGDEIVDMALTISPIRDEQGAVVAVSTIARDLTEQRWRAETLNTTLARLENARRETRAAEERSREFLSRAAHQLRSPIAGVKACAETLLRGPPAVERDGLLASLVREASRASRLISSLLHLARLDEGMPPVAKPVDVVEICRHELDRARLFAPLLALELHGLEAAVAVADGEAVREILANLIENARRHAKSRIDLTVAAAGARVEVSVANDGPLVPDGMAEKIFERFLALDGSGGSGLGLAIARGLARAYGGDVTYTNDRFLLSLPTATG